MFNGTLLWLSRIVSPRKMLKKPEEKLAVAEADAERAAAATTESVRQAKTAQERLLYAEARLADTRIVSPFDGLVVRRDRETGDGGGPGRFDFPDHFSQRDVDFSMGWTSQQWRLSLRISLPPSYSDLNPGRNIEGLSLAWDGRWIAKPGNSRWMFGSRRSPQLGCGTASRSIH